MTSDATQTEPTWKDVVADALEKLGGEAHLDQITEVALRNPKAATNSRVKEKVRQVVRAYSIFETLEEGSGVYRLKQEEESLGVAAPTTKEITDQIQGQLLYVGRANGFQTWAPADDQTKRVFGNEPLRELVTLQNGFDELTRFREQESKVIRQIDVLWFEEYRDELIPRCAFEIEHTTEVLTGLERLNQVPHFFSTRLFIVGPDDSKKQRFDSLMNSATWKREAQRFKFRYFNEVQSLFDAAAGFQAATEQNQSAMQNFLT